MSSSPRGRIQVLACCYLFHLSNQSITTESRTRQSLYHVCAMAITMKSERLSAQKRKADLYWFTLRLQCFDYLQTVRDVGLFCPSFLTAFDQLNVELSHHWLPSEILDACSCHIGSWFFFPYKSSL